MENYKYFANSKEAYFEHKHDNDIFVNPRYFIRKFKYKELQYFCRQYNDWVEYLEPNNYFYENHTNERVDGGKTSDTTAAIAIKMADCKNKIDLVDRVAGEVAGEFAQYIKFSAVNAVSYRRMVEQYHMPLDSYDFYEMMQKFWWTLAQYR